jgi:hypothetical protein
LEGDAGYAAQYVADYLVFIQGRYDDSEPSAGYLAGRQGPRRSHPLTQDHRDGTDAG